MKVLDTLHINGYVHSDVQAANFLFPVDTNQEAKLIDFDLVGMENVPYPQVYNRIRERHPTAIANFPRLKLHDRYSIVYIIEEQSFYSMFSDTKIQLLTSVKDGKCNLKLQVVFEQIIM